MKALVTGGMGFIGGAVVNKLLRDGNRVVVVDNMFDPVFRTMADQRNRKLTLHTLDCRNLDGLLKLDDDIDVVFHFAAHYANERSLQEPLASVSINMLGTMAVLEFCRIRGVKRLVYASSSGVYGSMDIVAYSENQPPAPSTPYEVTKYSGELLCSGYCEIYGISLVAPRYFNVYGPGDVAGEWRAVIPKFFALAKRGEPLVITGENASRDFTYIDDVVEGTLAGLTRVDEAPSRITLIYNIGTGREVFVKHLAGLVVKVSGSKSEVITKPKRNWDNAPRRVADCHKYQALFPDIANRMRSIDTGLQDACEWYMDVC
jgi:nucleoside-diphosphate-sugar epimerase